MEVFASSFGVGIAGSPTNPPVSEGETIEDYRLKHEHFKTVIIKERRSGLMKSVYNNCKQKCCLKHIKEGGPRIPPGPLC